MTSFGICPLFCKFVEAGIAETDRDLERVLKASPLAIGSEKFVEWVRGLHDTLSGRSRRPEDATLRRRAGKLRPERVIEIVCGRMGADTEDVRQRRRGSLLRPITARMLCRYSGLTQRQAGEYLNLATGAAVSIQLKNLASAASSKRQTREKLSEIEEAIRSEIDQAPMDTTTILSFKG